MKFIFPQNYNFRGKLFGFLDYSSAILISIIGFILYIFINFFNFNFSFKFAIFIILFLPVLLLSIVGFNNESLFYVITYITHFLFNPKIYCFKKSND